MGVAQSRQADDDDVFIESGVRITQGLLEQLDGKPRPQLRPGGGGGLPLAAGGGGGGATSQALRTSEDVAFPDAAAVRGGDRALARTLQSSRRVGGMLLKAEQEELVRVGQLADEMLASEYAAPAAPRPCGQQAEDCVRCYAEHGDDPLACAAAVEAYGACAKAAWREAVARHAL